MKDQLLPLLDKLLSRKRSIIETINDQLKNISQIEHTRHRSVTNCMINIIAGLIAYTHQEKKPALDLADLGLDPTKALVRVLPKSRRRGYPTGPNKNRREKVTGLLNGEKIHSLKNKNPHPRQPCLCLFYRNMFCLSFSTGGRSWSIWSAWSGWNGNWPAIRITGWSNSMT
jgi:hypothetical protein